MASSRFVIRKPLRQKNRITRRRIDGSVKPGRPRVVEIIS
jgi:hypothetical protein